MQRERLVRKAKECQRGTHLLWVAEGLVRTVKLSQRTRDAHFLSNTDGGGDSSGKRKKASERGGLTNCQEQEAPVRATKQSHGEKGTHVLSNAERGTRRNSERKSASEGRSPSVERKVRDDSTYPTRVRERLEYTNRSQHVGKR
jgi:hypothetical protein